MMRFWIVVDGFNKEIELPDELADRFYKRLTKKYCKDNVGNDSFTVEHNGVKVAVVIRRENKMLDGIHALDRVKPKDVFEVKFPWREGKKWDVLQTKLDTEADFWKIIEYINAFFKKYQYVTLVTIYPESVIPHDCEKIDDFFEQAVRSSHSKVPGIVNEIVMIAKAVQNTAMREQCNPSSAVPPPSPPPPSTPQEMLPASPPEEDIADTIEKLEGRWVSSKDFRNTNINSWRSPVTGQIYTKNTMQKHRETGNYILSSKTITAGRDAGGVLGKDKGGVYFKRFGNAPSSYRYKYFLEDKYNLTLSSDQK